MANMNRPPITIQARGEGTARRWRVWIGDLEISSIVHDVVITAGIDKVTLVTLTLLGYIVTQETLSGKDGL